MKNALVAEVFADLALQRLQVSQDVAMSDDYTARLGGRAGGEDNLHHIIASERRRSHGLIGERRELLAQGFQVDLCDARDVVLHRANTEPGVHLLRDTLGEIRGRDLVDGYHDGAAQQASEKGNHPLGAVLAPEDDLVALADAALFQFARKAIRIAQHIAVSPPLHAITAMLNVGHLASVAAEVIEVFQDGGACHRSQFNRWSDGRVRASAAPAPPIMERGVTPNRERPHFRLPRSRRLRPIRCYDSGPPPPPRRECSQLVADSTPRDSRRNVPAVPRRRANSGTEDAEAATWWGTAAPHRTEIGR